MTPTELAHAKANRAMVASKSNIVGYLEQERLRQTPNYQTSSRIRWGVLPYVGANRPMQLTPFDIPLDLTGN